MAGFKAVYEGGKLHEAVRRVIGAVDRETDKSGLWIRAEKGGTRLTGIDPGARFETSVDGKVTGEGEYLIATATLEKLIATIPSDRQVTIGEDKEKGHLVVTSNGSHKFKGKLPLVAGVKLPPAASKEKADATVQVTKDALLAALKTTLACAASDSEGREFLKGVLFEVRDKTLRLVSTDSHRLARVDVSAAGVKGDGRFLLPRRALSCLARSLDGDAVIRLTEKYAEFQTPGSLFRMSLIAQEFPNYQSIMPKEYKHTVVVDRLAVIQALKLAEVFTETGQPRVILTFTANTLTITSEHISKGAGDVRLGVECGGDIEKIAFNAAYLRGALEHTDGDKVSLQMNAPTAPASVVGAPELGCIHLVMPMR